MSRYERGRYFEAICALRDGYATLSDEDTRSVLLVDDAIIYAEAVMRALDDGDDALDIAADAGIRTEAGSSADPRD
jgi:hypothetical protein